MWARSWGPPFEFPVHVLFIPPSARLTCVAHLPLAELGGDSIVKAQPFAGSTADNLIDVG